MLDERDLLLLLSSLALPLGILGVILRARGRRLVDEARRLASARRDLRDVQLGVVVVRGRWHGSAGGRGVIEHEGVAVIIDRGAGAATIADGAEVICHGVARSEAADPRGGGYRGPGRLRVVDCSGADDFVTTDLARFTRATGRGRRMSRIGMGLVSLAVAAVVFGVALSAMAHSADCPY